MKNKYRQPPRGRTYISRGKGSKRPKGIGLTFKGENFFRGRRAR